MCIIISKPRKSAFPSYETLKNCFDNNPDGAGYMVAIDGHVMIHKGFVTFSDFKKSLKKTREKYGDGLAYVMHFRISTQAGTRPDCTHPYPLSDDINDLRKLNTTCEIGVAHNGIISLTSEYDYTYIKGVKTSKNEITYNDTMKFITDYLSLIIRNKSFYKDKKTILLIERLCESKLAILDSDGHCELIGAGWSLIKGCYYSNNSYIKREPLTTIKTPTLNSKYYGGYAWSDYDDFDDYGMAGYWETFYDDDSGEYDFDDAECPYVSDGDCDYCLYCKNYDVCKTCGRGSMKTKGGAK